MKFLVSLFVLSTLIALNAQAAEEIDLACVAKANTRSGLITRGIIIGDDEEVVALTDSRGREVEAKKYAVVIQIVGGTGGEPAREEFEVLTGNEFNYKQVDERNYRVNDLKNGFKYVCSLNGVAHANPALTRTN